MRDIAKLNENDKKALFHNTAAKMGMTDAIIEKDFTISKQKDSKDESIYDISKVIDSMSNMFTYVQSKDLTDFLKCTASRLCSGLTAMRSP